MSSKKNKSEDKSFNIKHIAIAAFIGVLITAPITTVAHHAGYSLFPTNNSNELTLSFVVNNEEVIVTEVDVQELYEENEELRSEITSLALANESLEEERDSCQEQVMSVASVDPLTNISVIYNGQEVPLVGDRQAFIMEGRTFLSFAMLEEMFDYPVDFDSNTNTAIIGDRGAGQSEESVSLNEAAPLYDRIGRPQQAQHEDSVIMSGDTFRDVLVLGRSQAGHTFSPASLHNLGMQYSVLYGYVGREDGTSLRHATINFWGDGTLIDRIELDATDMPVQFSIPVEDVSQLKIELVIGDGSSDSAPRYAIQAFLE